MTYGECKRTALELIFDYQVAGTAIANTYNNQADYVARIPALVNAAQLEIATTTKRIPDSKLITALSQPVGETRSIYILPADCYKINDGGLLRLRRRSIERTKNYSIIFGGKQIFVYEDDLNDLYLEYWRYPAVLSSPADSAELDNTLDAQQCVPYYVAAQLVLYDDPYRYASLLNEYKSRVAALSNQLLIEEGTIGNEYGYERSD